MIRFLSIGIFSVFIAISCFGQKQVAQKNAAFLVTQTIQAKTDEHVEKDNARFLYVSNQTGDQIVVYKYSEGTISEAVDYQLIPVKSSLYLISKRLFSNQNEIDSLPIAFSDPTKSVKVGLGDEYMLFPQNYATYKAQINTKHSILKLVSLLADNIGDYPIGSLLPLITTTSGNQFDRCIQKAKIVTNRDQADIKDAWSCDYTYNKAGKINAVKASSGSDIRFSKTVSYSANQIVVKSYQNIEDRQVTNKEISIRPLQRNEVNWKETVLETGKNRETELLTSLSKKDLGTIAKVQMTQAEAVNFIKNIK